MFIKQGDFLFLYFINYEHRVFPLSEYKRTFIISIN